MISTLGLQSGIPILKLDPNKNQLEMSQKGINPLISMVLGITIILIIFSTFLFKQE